MEEENKDIKNNNISQQDMLLKERLQKTLNILQSKSSTYQQKDKSRWERFKIEPTIIESKPYMGKMIDENVENIKYKFLPHLLKAYYRYEVEKRGGTITSELDNATFTRIITFLSKRESNPGLLLCGTPGTGKTTYMKAIENTIRELYKDDTFVPDVLFVKASSLGFLMKSEHDRFEKVKKCAVLFIDDVGFAGEAETVNDYGVRRQPIIDIFEHRYDNQLMTVCSTNLTQSELFERYGERIHSRMMEMFYWISFMGEDYRYRRSNLRKI